MVSVWHVRARDHARIHVNTSDDAMLFFEAISHGANFVNFESPYGMINIVTCLPSIGDIVFDENAI
mgnify:FL=1